MDKVISFFDLTSEEVKEIEEKFALLEPLLDCYLNKKELREYREQVCIKLGISKRTLRRYVHKLKKKGLKALIRQQRSDCGKLRVFSPEILEKAKELLDENPFRSVPTLMDLLESDNELQDKVSRISSHTLYYHLKKSGYDFKKKWREEDERVYTRFEADYPNALWQGDARDGIYLPDPANSKQMKKTYLFAWVDDYSRKIMYAKYYWDEKLPRMEDCFRQAVLRWGLPLKLYCDNGACYISKYFLFLVNDLGIKKIHHPAYSAWCKGKVENIMKITKKFQREARLADIKTIEELNSTLTAWIEVDYNNKLHSTTGETPNNRYRKGILKYPPKRITDIDAFNILFFFREPRKVNKYGKVQFEKNYYPVKNIRIGTKVEVRFDPFDLSEVLIYKDKQFICKSKATLLKTKKLIQNIPCEKPAPKISQNSINYFNRLREKYFEQKVKETDSMRFSDLNKEEQE